MTGPLQPGSTVECYRCHGHGANCSVCGDPATCQHPWPDVYPCHICEGTGRVCATCEGEQIVARGFALDAPGRPDVIACPDCTKPVTA